MVLPLNSDSVLTARVVLLILTRSVILISMPWLSKTACPSFHQVHTISHRFGQYFSAALKLSHGF